MRRGPACRLKGDQPHMTELAPATCQRMLRCCSNGVAGKSCCAPRQAFRCAQIPPAATPKINAACAMHSHVFCKRVLSVRRAALLSHRRAVLRDLPPPAGYGVPTRRCLPQTRAPDATRQSLHRGLRRQDAARPGGYSADRVSEWARHRPVPHLLSPRVGRTADLRCVLGRSGRRIGAWLHAAQPRWAGSVQYGRARACRAPRRHGPRAGQARALLHAMRAQHRRLHAAQHVRRHEDADPALRLPAQAVRKGSQ